MWASIGLGILAAFLIGIILFTILKNKYANKPVVNMDDSGKKDIVN